MVIFRGGEDCGVGKIIVMIELVDGSIEMELNFGVYGNTCSMN